MIDVNEGRTNTYLMQGLLVLGLALITGVVGFTTSLFFLIPSATLLVVSIIVFGATTGLQIDTELMQYRKYGEIGSYVFGHWVKFKNIERASLVHSIENIYRPGMATSSRTGSSMSTIITTYDIQFIDSSYKRSTIYEFGEYKDARRALKQIHEQMEVSVANKVAEKMAENKRARR